MLPANIPLFDYAPSLVHAAHKAGRVAMAAFKPEIVVRYKADRSPVTEADLAAEEVILVALHEVMPGVPVIAEEMVSAGRVPDVADAFFLVDPIDGTRGFAAGSPEFTVNIALIQDRRPVFGLVYAPALALCLVTLGAGQAVSFKLPHEADVWDGAFDAVQPLPGPLSRDPDKRIAVVSRSRAYLAKTEAFFASQRIAEVVEMSSSLKLGMLALGRADVYPRFGPTSEWDIAAGHAIVEAAGGAVLTDEGAPFLYGKRDKMFLNPHFIAWRQSLKSELP